MPASMRQRRRLAWVCALVLAVATTQQRRVLASLPNSAHAGVMLPKHGKGDSRIQAQELRADELVYDSSVAFVMYAPPSYARQLKCEAAVESLRSQGRWGGHIYFITDNVQCYEHERWTQCGLDAEIILLTGQLPTSNLIHNLFSTYSQRLRDHQVRTQLWEIVNPPADVQLLVFMDGCDTIFGASVEPFIAAAAARMAGADGKGRAAAAAVPKPSLLILPHDRVHSSGAPDHDDSGVVWVLHREQSKAFLEAWWHEAQRDPGHSKSDLLMAALQRIDPSCHSRKGTGLRTKAVGLQGIWGVQDVCREQHAPHLGRGHWLRALQCSGLEECATAVPAVFNLLPASACISVGRAEVALFVEGLDLCTYQDVPVCLPLLMRPLALPWLPLPMCTKLELGLARMACQWSCTDVSYMRTSSFMTSITRHDMGANATSTTTTGHQRSMA